MGLFKKTINYEYKFYMISLFIVSVILNILTLIIPRDNIEYVTLPIDLIIFTLGFVCLYNIHKAFTEERAYLHIVPVSKKRIFLDIIFYYILIYTLSFITRLVFIYIKVDINYLVNNANIKGIVIEWTANYINGILGVVAFGLLILLCKIYNKITKLVVIAILISIFLPRTSDSRIDNHEIKYTYESKVDIFKIERYRVAQTLEDEIIKREGNIDENYFIGPEAYKREVSYNWLIINMVEILILFPIVFRNIERANIHNEIKVKERKALYERKWYDKWK